MAGTLNVLFIGDIVSQLGRRAVQQVVAKLRKQESLDLVIANIENLAHGKGITKGTLAEIQNIGIDAFTTGNHVWAQPEGKELLAEAKNQIIRPANYPPNVPGRGYCIIKVKTKKVLLINLIGRVFMKLDYDDPFRKFDEILKEAPKHDEVIVDFHAEATSEKVAFAWYAAGRASLVVGTHTHIPTADAELLSKHKLGYVTDVGMVGPKDSILGVQKDEIIEAFLTQLPVKHKMVETGDIVFNSVLAKLKNHQSIQIKRIDMIIEGR
ncbi:MAG: hypothetical protein A2445_02550 [Candidatus Jacksonbacteria bacterium RIFOXYC2_FULL_44_29]|nr:MAG: Metallophosphoesterase [Parcubacteria group bacterium GW2011_GWA2_42_28]KKT55882.1 MAG: Metallophosphoesterase [Parcubacteria group bacterium GW2011_GWC2_44_22]OGY74497.1 MAG: hypothetical protein A2240_02810 [Candidatus Jacksonbacteria bacterium RIFOXYA2_FULL_43_12]OGY77406.1 MAG: hypothetical protein A2295_01760 [Candidatus Jacksonbacteria bacterium RIFOXYB2_FULL_44_15]OGY78178.1 MAG: hypothetical protein A2550_06105 [Candidatus Jacksonbacteria bacterium RIFOXYD2_FULL_43_21]OGY80755.